MSLGLEAEAAAVESAVEKCVSAGIFTADIAAGGPVLSTKQVGDAVVNRILQ
jgi:3-isopropylmalate dehydrogenase